MNTKEIVARLMLKTSQDAGPGNPFNAMGTLLSNPLVQNVLKSKATALQKMWPGTPATPAVAPEASTVPPPPATPSPVAGGTAAPVTPPAAEGPAPAKPATAPTTPPAPIAPAPTAGASAPVTPPPAPPVGAAAGPAPAPSTPVEPKPAAPAGAPKASAPPVTPVIDPDKVNKMVGDHIFKAMEGVAPGVMSKIEPAKMEEALTSDNPREAVQGLVKQKVSDEAFGKIEGLNKQISDNWVSEVGNWLTNSGGWKSMLAPVGALLALFGGDIGKVVGGLMMAGGAVNEFTSGGIINRVKGLMNPNQLDTFALSAAAKAGLGNDPQQLQATIAEQAAKMMPGAAPQDIEAAVAKSVQWVGDYKLAASFGLANQKVEEVKSQTLNGIDNYFAQNAQSIDNSLAAAKAAHSTVRGINQLQQSTSFVPGASTAIKAITAPFSGMLGMAGGMQ